MRGHRGHQEEGEAESEGRGRGAGAGLPGNAELRKLGWTSGGIVACGLCGDPEGVVIMGIISESCPVSSLAVRMSHSFKSWRPSLENQALSQSRARGAHPSPPSAVPGGWPYTLSISKALSLLPFSCCLCHKCLSHKGH